MLLIFWGFLKLIYHHMNLQALFRTWLLLIIIFFHLPRPVRLGGGVRCFIKSSFTGTIIPTPKFLTFDVLVLQVKSSNLCFYFTSIYRPWNASKSTFLNEFQSFIGFLSTFPSPFSITGDFNIHMDTVSLYSGKFKQIRDACYLIQHVK
jgi:hypothetical protein